MTLPEQALEDARAAAARARAGGAYGDDLRGFAVEPFEGVSLAALLEWAVLEPDVEPVRSTRRLGAPITWVKRGLVRLLRQYLGQIVAQQTRFNVHVVTFVSQLEDRVTRLEAGREEEGAGPS